MVFFLLSSGEVRTWSQPRKTYERGFRSNKQAIISNFAHGNGPGVGPGGRISQAHAKKTFPAADDPFSTAFSTRERSGCKTLLAFFVLVTGGCVCAKIISSIAKKNARIRDDRMRIYDSSASKSQMRIAGGAQARARALSEG